MSQLATDAAEGRSAAVPGRTGVRLLAGCVAFFGLAMVQAPGFQVADTKFDLVLDPGSLLRRSLHLWDPIGTLGQLQNQGYGYLWPMGPFFWLGHTLDVPGWAVQRLWMGLVLATAFLGAALLARALGVRSDVAVVVTGVAFALSPRLLTTIGPISIEGWPSALAPWVLLPLVVGSTRGSPRRAAAWSALAVAMVGGVNAAATSAVLPLGVLWLITRSAGPRRRALILWWPVFVLLGTLWWLVPLVTLGTYSPPFLDYIETADTTTFPTSLADALRGTSDWVPYVDASWQAGNQVLRGSTIAVDLTVLLLLGLIGICLRRNPHRVFLACGVGAGLFLVTMGHVGTAPGFLAGTLHTELDGALAPVRNVHKFDVVLRLPLVVGLGWSVDAAWTALRSARADAHPDRALLAAARLRSGAVVFSAVLATLGAALPAVEGRLTPTGATLAVPDYWRQAIAYVDHPDENPAQGSGAGVGATLMLPGSSFADYVWGRPQDEPIQALATRPWVVRSSIPLAPPGTIRMLDAIETAVHQGSGSAALTDYLRRAGIARILVRNDLSRSGDVTDPVLVHQALEESPGIVAARSFGPMVGGDAHLDAGVFGRIVIAGGWQARYPAIEVYRVTGASQSASAGAATTGTAVTATATTAPSPVVVGGPEDLLDLMGLGILGDQPTVLATDVPEGAGLQPGTHWVLTDGLRDVERSFGRIDDAESAVRTPNDPRRLGGAATDYLPTDADRWLTRARYAGVSDISASSSLSDANNPTGVERGHLPYAAADGQPSTTWSSLVVVGQTPWWQETLETARSVQTVSVTADPDAPSRVRIRTDHATTPAVVVPAGETVEVAVGDPSTRTVRVEDAAGGSQDQLTLTDVSVPGVTARRILQLPRTPTSWADPDSIVLRAIDDRRTGCIVIDGDVRCVAGKAVPAEEPLGFRRGFTLARTADYGIQLRVRARPVAAAEQLLQAGGAYAVTASSQGVPDLRASALAAVDADRHTTWIAAPNDLRPSLQLSWLGRRSVDRLTLTLDPDAAARLPNELTLVWSGGSRTVKVGAAGYVRFPAIRTDQLTLEVDQADPGVSLGFDAQASGLPVGISGLRVHGVPFDPLRLSTEPTTYACGSGPDVTVDGQTMATAVTAAPADLAAGDEAAASVCGQQSAAMGPGDHEVDVMASSAFTPTSVVLTRDGSTGLDTSAPMSQGPAVTSQGSVTQTITGAEPGTLLALGQNENPGWHADQDGRALTPQVVDGWRQGWQVAGSGVVHTRFAPDRIYRWGLLGGAITLLALASALIAMTVLRRRRPNRDPEPEPEPLTAARPPAAVLVALALLGGGLLAGIPGLICAILAAAATWLVRGRWTQASVVLLAMTVVPAFGVYALRPWGSLHGWAGALSWPSYLVVAAWVVVMVEWRADDGRFLPRFRKR